MVLWMAMIYPEIRMLGAVVLEELFVNWKIKEKNKNTSKYNRLTIYDLES